MFCALRITPETSPRGMLVVLAPVDCRAEPFEYLELSRELTSDAAELFCCALRRTVAEKARQHCCFLESSFDKRFDEFIS